MDFTIIDKARDWDELKQAYYGENIWLIIQKPDGKLGVCVEKYFEQFKKDFINKEKQIEVIQLFEDGVFYYRTECNSFVTKGI